MKGGVPDTTLRPRSVAVTLPQPNEANQSMKITLLLAEWEARRLETRARLERRTLRDFQRLELNRIHRAEKRSRGLRLFIAWSRPSEPYLMPERVHGWRRPLDQAA